MDVGTEIALVAVGGDQHDEPSPEEAPSREDAASEAPTEEFPAAGTEAQPVAGRRREATSGRRSARRDEKWRDGRGEIESAETLRLTRSSPVVRRLAGEHDVDIAEIPGTGTGGRVTKKDIEGYIEEREEEYATPGPEEEREAFAPPEEPPEVAPTGEPEREPAPERVEVHEGDRVVELTSIRRAIADRMSRASARSRTPGAWSRWTLRGSCVARAR